MALCSLLHCHSGFIQQQRAAFVSPRPFLWWRGAKEQGLGRLHAAGQKGSSQALWESLDPHRKALGGEQAAPPCSEASCEPAPIAVHSPGETAKYANTRFCTVDFGTVKCGLAVSVGGLAPRPLKVTAVGGTLSTHHQTRQPSERARVGMRHALTRLAICAARFVFWCIAVCLETTTASEASNTIVTSLSTVPSPAVLKVVYLRHAELLEEIRQTARAEGVEEIVVGMPGPENKSVRRIQQPSPPTPVYLCGSPLRRELPLHT